MNCVSSVTENLVGQFGSTQAATTAADTFAREIDFIASTLSSSSASSDATAAAAAEAEAAIVNFDAIDAAKLAKYNGPRRRRVVFLFSFGALRSGEAMWSYRLYSASSSSRGVPVGQEIPLLSRPRRWQ